MTTIARFKNTTDAAFFQSLLRSEGIESLVIDAGAVMTMSDDIRVEVAADDVAAAAELKARYERESLERAQLVEATHPAKGIPFGAIWFFAGIATFVLWDGFIAYALVTGEFEMEWSGLQTIGVGMLMFLCAPIFLSLFIAVDVFIVCLVWRVMKKRFVVRTPASTSALASTAARGTAGHGHYHF